VSEGGHARPDFAEQAAVEHLAQPGVAAELGKQLELDLHADHGGSLQGGVSLVRQALGPDSERVSKRFGDRHAGSLLELEATRSRPEPGPHLERGRQFLHEERHALCAVVERRAKRWAGLGVENPRCDLSGRIRIERLDAELGEPACSA
jgi:hypothetical protein